jgi:MtN3 and saliva related transmembrane protein
MSAPQAARYSARRSPPWPSDVVGASHPAKITAPSSAIPNKRVLISIPHLGVHLGARRLGTRAHVFGSRTFPSPETPAGTSAQRDAGALANMYPHSGPPGALHGTLRNWFLPAGVSFGIRRNAMDIAAVVGTLAALASTISFSPQAWKIIKSRRTDDISPVAYSITVAAFGLWILYGIVLGQWPLIVSNSICLALSGFILAMTLLPQSRKDEVANTLDPER